MATANTVIAYEVYNDAAYADADHRLVCDRCPLLGPAVCAEGIQIAAASEAAQQQWIKSAYEGVTS